MKKKIAKNALNLPFGYYLFVNKHISNSRVFPFSYVVRQRESENYCHMILEHVMKYPIYSRNSRLFLKGNLRIGFLAILGY